MAKILATEIRVGNPLLEFDKTCLAPSQEDHVTSAPWRRLRCIEIIDIARAARRAPERLSTDDKIERPFIGSPHDDLLVPRWRQLVLCTRTYEQAHAGRRTSRSQTASDRTVEVEINLPQRTWPIGIQLPTTRGV